MSGHMDYETELHITRVELCSTDRRQWIMCSTGTQQRKLERTHELLDLREIYLDV